MKNNCAVLRAIMENAQKELNALSEHWDMQRRQTCLISAISIYDKLFVDSISPQAEQLFKPFYLQIIRYSYPVFIRAFYSPEYERFPDIAIQPVDESTFILYTKLIYCCGIIGWMQKLIDDINAGTITYSNVLNHVFLKFNQKYHWNEYLEQEYKSWYSKRIVQIQQKEYDKLNAHLPSILERIEKSVFVWRDYYMGYSSDEEIESFFNKLAFLDSQQGTEWDFFPGECKFDGVFYSDIVQAIIDFSGYAMKHINCAVVLKQSQQDLRIENLLTCVYTEDDLIKLIACNQEIEEGVAKKVLSYLSLTSNGMDYYDHTLASCAPFLKISKSQYIFSIKGFLNGAYDFALFRLRSEYPRDWDRNVNKRESEFKKQLYSLFQDQRFICIPNTIFIKKDGKVETDIDAAVIDKITGEIALIQLKWQDPSTHSSFALKSKAHNYSAETEKWLDIVSKWISENDESEIARCMNVKKKYVHKEHIMIFVLGRHHGTYSSSNKPTIKCAWVQWYQLLYTISYLSQQTPLSLSLIYEHLLINNPANKIVLEQKSTFVYEKYHIHYGGGIIQ